MSFNTQLCWRANILRTVSITVNWVNPVAFVVFVVEEAEFDTKPFRCFAESEPFRIALFICCCWEGDAAPVVTDSRSFHFSFTLNSTLLLLDLVHLMFLRAFINMTAGYWLGLTVLSVFKASQNYAASHKGLLCQINCFATEILVQIYVWSL